MKIEILLFDGFDDLDAFGPFEVLAGARMDTTFVTVEPRRCVTSAGGARIVPHGVLGDPDLVLVPGGGWNDRGGPGAYAEAQRGVIPARSRAPRGRRALGSVCTGAMLLAEAGILTGRRATTHHTSHEDLKTYGVDVSRTPASSTRATSSPPPASPRASTWRCTSSTRPSARGRRGRPPTEIESGTATR